jgi:hypothetical protein
VGLAKRRIEPIPCPNDRLDQRRRARLAAIARRSQAPSNQGSQGAACSVKWREVSPDPTDPHRATAYREEVDRLGPRSMSALDKRGHGPRRNQRERCFTSVALGNNGAPE